MLVKYLPVKFPMFKTFLLFLKSNTVTFLNFVLYKVRIPERVRANLTPVLENSGNFRHKKRGAFAPLTSNGLVMFTSL